MYKFVLATIFLTVALTAPAGDLVNVSAIPGYLQNPNFTTYSGYLSLNQFYNTTKEMHYVFVTSINNPQTDPLLLWLNGGPGCSSLEGWLSEIGPCVFDDMMTALNGSFNPYTWAQNASLLFLEAPAGVGFSWVADEKEEQYNDNVTTTDMYLSLQAWFKEFPEWNNHYFYIAGESYAGIYIPRLASRIVQENANTSNTGYQNINLTGIMVGNGVTIQDTLTFTGPEFLYYHNLIPGDLYNRFYDSCTANLNSAECNSTQNEISDLTATVNPYDIYRYCYNDYTTGGACATALGWTDLLRQEAAMEALHVTEYNITWSDCSDYIGDVYVPIQPGSLSDYLFLKDKIKILVYSGDADSVVPFTDTYGWIYSNFNVIKDAQVWSVVPGQQAGLITIFDGIIYATVRGAGHMVPAWRRLQAYTMFLDFTHNISPFVWQP